MLDPNFLLLYVDDPAASAAFYQGLLGRAPVEASPIFVLFALDSGVMLGLWSRHSVEPAPVAGGAELAVAVADGAVDATFAGSGRPPPARVRPDRGEGADGMTRYWVAVASADPGDIPAPEPGIAAIGVAAGDGADRGEGLQPVLAAEAAGRRVIGDAVAGREPPQRRLPAVTELHEAPGLPAPHVGPKHRRLRSRRLSIGWSSRPAGRTGAIGCASASLRSARTTSR